MKNLRRFFWYAARLRGIVRGGLAVGSALALLGFAANSAAVAAQSQAPKPVALPGFQSCVLGLQGAVPRYMSLSEARRCEAGLPEVQRSDVARLGQSGQLPSTFLVVWAGHAALEWTSSAGASTQLVGARITDAVLTSCYNSWSYPNPSFWYPIEWGNLYTAGYGNHCGYANIPSTPTFSVGCVCTGISKSAGHADSTWDNAHYGINSALGWGNVYFYEPLGIDSFACRAWVNTNGAHSPSAYCY